MSESRHFRKRRKSMKPVRMWIDGQSYTITEYDSNFLKKENVDKIAKLNEEKMYSTKFGLPSLYFIELFSKYRSQINVVESKTGTCITYPQHGNEGMLKISGNCKESIEEAKVQIISFIADLREQFSALQFISIPLLSQEVKQNYEAFKNSVLAENYQGVEKSIFVSSLKLHMTIVVFTLLSEQEKLEVLNTLYECKKLFSRKFDHKSNPVKIKVQGLNCMNSNLSKVNVLYAEPCLTENSDSEKSLQEIANTISDLFYEKGFVRGYTENVKLHMTLMNTKYKNKRNDKFKKKWIKRETFNATQIMEKYKDYYFGEAVFDTIHLSIMSSVGEDGFYSSLGMVKIFEL